MCLQKVQQCVESTKAAQWFFFAGLLGSKAQSVNLHYSSNFSPCSQATLPSKRCLLSLFLLFYSVLGPSSPKVCEWGLHRRCCLLMIPTHAKCFFSPVLWWREKIPNTVWPNTTVQFFIRNLSFGSNPGCLNFPLSRLAYFWFPRVFQSASKFIRVGLEWA